MALSILQRLCASVVHLRPYLFCWQKIFLIFGWLAGFPRMIAIAKLNPVGDARVRPKPGHKKCPWSRYAQIHLHKSYKSSGSGVVLVGKFQAKPVGLMLEVPRERHVNGQVSKAKKPERQHTQRHRCKIRR